MHDTRLCQLDAKPTRNKRYLYTKPVKMEKKQVYTTYTSSQKTRHQKLNSYLVMNSLGDSPIHTAAQFVQVIKIEYMYKCMHYKDTSSSSS